MERFYFEFPAKDGNKYIEALTPRKAACKSQKTRLCISKLQPFELISV